MVYIECNIRKRIFVTIYFEIINKNRPICKNTNRSGSKAIYDNQFIRSSIPEIHRCFLCVPYDL